MIDEKEPDLPDKAGLNEQTSKSLLLSKDNQPLSSFKILKKFIVMDESDTFEPNECHLRFPILGTFGKINYDWIMDNLLGGFYTKENPLICEHSLIWTERKIDDSNNN